MNPLDSIEIPKVRHWAYIRQEHLHPEDITIARTRPYNEQDPFGITIFKINEEYYYAEHNFKHLTTKHLAKYINNLSDILASRHRVVIPNQLI